MAHLPVQRELTVDEICWTLTDTPSESPASSDAVDLAVEALLDAEAYRALAQTALHSLAALQVRCDRLRARHAEKREQERTAA